MEWGIGVMAESRRELKKRVFEKMTILYCRGQKHPGSPCEDCRTLIDYAFRRVELCPFEKDGTFCSSCKVHCFQDEMRENVKKVMRYSGPRIFLHHPILVMRLLTRRMNRRF